MRSTRMCISTVLVDRIALHILLVYHVRTHTYLSGRWYPHRWSKFDCIPVWCCYAADAVRCTHRIVDLVSTTLPIFFFVAATLPSLSCFCFVLAIWCCFLPYVPPPFNTSYVSLGLPFSDHHVGHHLVPLVSDRHSLPADRFRCAFHIAEEY